MWTRRNPSRAGLAATLITIGVLIAVGIWYDEKARADAECKPASNSAS